MYDLVLLLPWDKKNEEETNVCHVYECSARKGMPKVEKIGRKLASVVFVCCDVCIPKMSTFLGSSIFLNCFESFFVAA